MKLLRAMFKYWGEGKRQSLASKNKARLGWNIYDSGATVEQHQKNFYHVHFVVKYRLFMPLITFIGRVMGRYLKKTVPDMPHNVNISLFHKSVEQAIDVWVDDYLRTAYGERRSDEWCKNFKHNYATQTLLLLRDLGVTGLLYDTAYRELFNIWAHTFTRLMVDHHTAKGTQDRTGHLYFTNQDVYDVDYYMLFKKIQTERHMTLHNLDPVAYQRERLEVQERLRKHDFTGQ